MEDRYAGNEHDFDPRDFEPGRVHRIARYEVMFGDDMTPAVVLWDPKYSHNVAAAVRAASCFGGRLVVFSGDRIPISGKKGWRLPREERMRGYGNVTIINDGRVFDRFSDTVTPVAVEMRQNSEHLPTFVHPEKALYVFGPEDGSLPKPVIGSATASWSSLRSTA